MSCFIALDKFVRQYYQSYLQRLDEPPRFYAQNQPSECVIKPATEEALVYWQPVLRSENGSFSNVESALELQLHSDIAEFYGRYYSGCLLFESKWGEGELIQPWNADDFDLLQQNIIGHLMMKRKLKQPLTWFIGVLGDGDIMLTVNNQTGVVAKEVPGEEQSEVLADSLEAFLEQLTVKVAPPNLPAEEVVAAVEHPGIFASFKRMWRNLTGR